MSECYLLARLPAELRVRIYEYLLSFDRPIKLRQVIPGSPNTAILRANRQIYVEALPVLYDANTIVVARNDFCLFTDAELKTPLNREQARHLLVKNFGHSIRCAEPYDPRPDACCDVCRPSATGFLKALVALPRLKSAMVDYGNFKREFSSLQGGLDGSTSGTAEAAPLPAPTEVLAEAPAAEEAAEAGGFHFSLLCTDAGRYVLQSSACAQLPSIVFSDIAFHQLWLELATRHHDFSTRGIPDEQAFLQSLYGRFDPRSVDYLYTVFCVCQPPLVCDVYRRLMDRWAGTDAAHEDGRAVASALQSLMEHAQFYLHMMETFVDRKDLPRLREAQAVDPNTIFHGTEQFW